jgi:prevent-host-death family protein
LPEKFLGFTKRSPWSTCDAKSDLSELLRRVERGEEIVIARAGKPVARLAPYTAPALTFSDSEQ